MAKRRGPSPEELARWEEERRQFAEVYERFKARMREAKEREERRRQLLRRLTFGLLGR